MEIPDIDAIVEWGGFAIIVALVYIETGFLLGLVVPGGETLMFTTGLLSGIGTLSTPVYLIIPILIAAAIVGDITGFYIGKRFGKGLYKKEDTWYFKKKHLKKVEEFYKKHGKLALILGRFLPIIRTFNPVFVGSTKSLPLRTFVLYVAIGAVAYTTSLVLVGYFLGQQFPWLKDYLLYIVIGIVIVAVVPVVLKFFRS